MGKEITIDKTIKIIYLIGYIVPTILFLAFIVAFSYFFPPDSFSRGKFVVISVLVLGVALVLFALLSVRLSDIWIIPWAFSRVKNVHELKERLILLGKITKDDTFLRKIENSTEYDRKYWKLRNKFTQEHIFTDDETIPEETFIYKYKRILKNSEPQLTLSSNGINSNKTGFHKWEEIWFCLISDGNLIYKYLEGGESIKLAYNEIKLSKLLYIYRERNKLQNKNNNQCTAANKRFHVFYDY